MGQRADPLALQHDVDHRARDGNEIQWQIQQRADQRSRREFIERPLDQLPESGDGVTARLRLQLPPVRNERIVTLGDQRAIEGVNEGLVQQE